MSKIIKIFIFILLTNLTSFSQYKKLTNQAEISIITIAQGNNLFDSFGHSSIRVKDNDLDKIYNYGVYDFNTPNFYTKFMQGKLLYNLETSPTALFLKFYANENRLIKEQFLNLNLNEKQEIFNFLENNAKPENKKYLYDFFFDNCATRLRDLAQNILVNNVNFNDHFLQKNYTHRDLIYQKLDKQIWGKFGIDIALGSVIDRKASAKEYTFLPSYIYKSFENATIKRDSTTVKLVKKTVDLYQPISTRKIKDNNFFISPMSLFILIGLVVLFITLNDYKRKKQSKWLDFIILFTTGLVGLLVFLLWFATDHKATGNNFNIFWAFVPNLIVAFLIFKQKKFLKNYYLLLILLLLVLVVFWLLKIQVFNIALVPILLFLMIRYLFLWKYLVAKS